jgi:hypothetical protein
MELDDLKRALALLDDRLDRQGLVQARQAGEGARHRLNDSLDALARGQTWTILWGLAMCLLGVAAWRGSLDMAPGAFVSGIVVHVFGALTIAAGAVIKALVARIDYSEPVIAIQRRVAKVQRAYVIAGIVVGMPWCFLWVPFMIVLFRALFGVDFSAADPWLMIELTGAGMLAMAATWLVYRRAKLAGRVGPIHGFEKIFAGRHLIRAQARIDAIAAFEHG